MRIARFGQPFFQNDLVLLLDLNEGYAHAVFAGVHHLPQSGENRAAMHNPQANFCSHSPGLCGIDAATKDAQVLGLLPDFRFRIHVDQLDGSCEWITASSRPLDQRVPPADLLFSEAPLSLGSVSGGHTTTTTAILVPKREHSS